nr:hypothetical protein [Ralstonia solanacearum]
MNGIDAEFVVAADAGAAANPLGQELVSAQRRVQLDQPAVLDHARADGVCDFRDVHALFYVRQNRDCRKTGDFKRGDYSKAIELRFVINR